MLQMNASNRKGTKSVLVNCTKFLIQLCLSLSLLQCTSAEPYLTPCPTPPTPMENKVVYEGSSASFPKVVTGQPVQWQVASSSSTQESLQDITEYDDKTTAPFVTTPPTYSADQLGLTISKATVETSNDIPFTTAGIYIQNYESQSCSAGAGLVVIRSGPTCSLDASDPNDVKLLCSVVFAGYVKQRINPMMTWTNGNGAVVLQETPKTITLNNSNEGLQNATSQFSVASNDVQEYGCQLNFTTPSEDLLQQAPFMATNAPSFTNSCSVHNIMVTAIPTTMITTTMIATTQPPPNPSLSSAAVAVLTTPPAADTTAPNVPVSTAPTSNPLVPISDTSTSSSLSPSSSVTPPSGQSSLSSTTVTVRPPTTTTTTASGSNAASLAIILGAVLGSFVVGAVVCSCWCFGCCQTPVAAKPVKRTVRRRRYYQVPYFSPWRYPSTYET